MCVCVCVCVCVCSPLSSCDVCVCVCVHTSLPMMCVFCTSLPVMCVCVCVHTSLLVMCVCVCVCLCHLRMFHNHYVSYFLTIRRWHFESHPGHHQTPFASHADCE